VKSLSGSKFIKPTWSPTYLSYALPDLIIESQI
jgi:hypothetical protein